MSRDDGEGVVDMDQRGERGVATLSADIRVIIDCVHVRVLSRGDPACTIVHLINQPINLDHASTIPSSLHPILLSTHLPHPQTMPIEKGESLSSTSILFPYRTDHTSPHTPVSTFPCNPSTQRLVGTKLSVDSKGEKIAYVNGRTVVVSDIAVRLKTKDIVVDPIKRRSGIFV